MRFHSSSVCLLVALLAGAVRADVIRLKTGRTIEGIVTQETDRQIVLGLGTGTTTLPRSMVVAVEYATEEANSRLQKGWKQKYFLHREYVPAEMTGLAAAFKKLGAAREEALRARRTLDDLSAREARLKTELEQVCAQLALVGRQIQESPTNRVAETYNVLVASNNILQVRRTAKADELAGCQKERAGPEERISAYLDAMARFCSQFAEEQKKQPASEGASADWKLFFGRMAQSLAEYAGDFSAVSVAAKPSSAGSIVLVTVNDLVQGRFIVDTGAARVTITEDFARRLQLDLATLPEGEFIMADGHKTTGHKVVFRALTVGDARVENVESAVLPGKPSEQVDGLLGMSFLKHFAFSVDGASGKLILRQFAPK